MTRLASALALSLVALGCGGAPALSDAALEAGPDTHEETIVTPRDLGEVIERGAVTTDTSARPTFGGLAVRLVGDRAHVLEGMRDEARNSSRRFSVFEGDRVVFRFAPTAREYIHSFAVHPSGEVTLAIERLDAERDAYELVRLSRDGAVRSRAPLPQPTTIPPGDLVGLPAAPFLMKSWTLEAISEGWVRLEARGDDLVAAYLSIVPDNGMDFVTGVSSLRWAANGYAERWSRIVEGRHRALPAGWAYDEFRWMDAAIRPLLALSDDGRIIVGRTWNNKRCAAVAAAFGEFTTTQCKTEAMNSIENERQPFAYTTFTEGGVREGTRRFLPNGFAEFVVFDLAARGDAIAIAGSAARSGPDPDFPVRYEGTYVAYDGYLAVLDRATGALRSEQVLDEGRGEFLASVRFTNRGLLAAGGADWDRWYGGMSISRGAVPWVVFAGDDGSVRRRTLDGGAGRHTHFFSIDATSTSITGVGLFDAPMTHSGDGGNTAGMTFGGLRAAFR